MSARPYLTILYPLAPYCVMEKTIKFADSERTPINDYLNCPISLADFTFPARACSLADYLFSDP
jgi:hypothetical protein